jgi:hypothetical protein
VLLLVLLGPPEGVELAVLGHDTVPLGLGVDDAQDPRLLLEGIPSVDSKREILPKSFC